MQPEFSAIITCYFEEKSIEEFHSRLSKAFQNTGRSYELIITNDGSTDATFAKLQELYQRDPHISSIMDFTRNFGQGAAMTAGIVEASGKNFLFIDSDLQLEPEQLPDLLSEFDKGHDIVSGFRKHRSDPLFRRILSRLAASVLRASAQTKTRDLGCTFRLVNGNLVRGLEFGPLKLFNQALILSKSNRQKEIEVRHHRRKFGKSGWTLRKLFDFYMENLVNVMSRPFQAIALGVASLAAVIVLRVVAGFFWDFQILPVVTTGLLLNAQVLLGLVYLACLAVVGEFGIRAFRVLQRDPLYVIRLAQRRQNSIPKHHDYTRYGSPQNLKQVMAS